MVTIDIYPLFISNIYHEKETTFLSGFTWCKNLHIGIFQFDGSLIHNYVVYLCPFQLGFSDKQLHIKSCVSLLSLWNHLLQVWCLSAQKLLGITLDVIAHMQQQNDPLGQWLFLAGLHVKIIAIIIILANMKIIYHMIAAVLYKAIDIWVRISMNRLIKLISIVILFMYSIEVQCLIS